MISRDGLTKECPDCLRYLGVAAFGHDKTSSDGLACYCRPCMRARQNGTHTPRLSRAHERIMERLRLGLKTCPLCHASKPLDDYYRSKKAADGHFGYCKVCHVTVVRRRQREVARAALSSTAKR